MFTGHNGCARENRVSVADDMSRINGDSTESTMASTAGTSSMLQGGSEERHMMVETRRAHEVGWRLLPV
jgi:hypothetical protein